MEIFVNGETKSLDKGMLLAEFIQHLGMKSDRVAVERNHAIVPRSEWATTLLQEGDRLEIVHFVGGGVN